jgi:regulator of sirC expression with transglutaminase-like and TPR domain
MSVTSGGDNWARLTAGPEDGINLAEAALAIAAEEYTDLDIAGYLERLDEMGSTLRRRLRPDITTGDSIRLLNHYLFQELGFSGDTENYYDPRNSFLNEVIERRLGIPITLSVIYIEVGRRIGLPLHGVSLPAHFLVKCVVREGAILLDPYSKGISLGLDDLVQRLKAWRGGIELDSEMVKNMLASAGSREILARILRNLRGIYLKNGQLTKALHACDRIVTLDPQSAEEYRDRGNIYLELECFRAALADFRAYLMLKPEAEDADEIQRKTIELAQRASRLN